ncbi:hypothetical protein GCM10023168_15060 [Fodinibacter luteus]|uniref:Uncharacterized protein n=1 Tax=Fodinibacter luteus TaxID=552064 RepID=A0ABP8KCP8_9MICO
MRLEWSGLRRPPVPPRVAAAIAPGGGERLLAWAVDAVGGGTVVAGRHRLYAVATGPTTGAEPAPATGAEPGPDAARVTLSRPWHLVDAGSWSGEDGILRVSWVDGHPPARFVLSEPGMLPETLRERVQASVVLAEVLDLGERRTARVVVRRDLASGALLSQAVLGSGVRSTDPGVAEQLREGLERVREQTGLT